MIGEGAFFRRRRGPDRFGFALRGGREPSSRRARIETSDPDTATATTTVLETVVRLASLRHRPESRWRRNGNSASPSRKKML
ncbi:hypothetical protein F8B43_1280 [Methylorubrum populi]|uniref:Uncharacterized protein n=1 Tax=Methylorubrum populi TaxID=223967 RepID=A0A833J7N9_9HYPH|nr:hypothetical protein F8B43_1280 [Methylorubrum populi]